MNKIKLVTLNMLCIILLLYFTALAWQRVVASTPFFDNDYKTFFISLEKDNAIYKPHFYFRVIKITHQQGKTTIQSNQKLSAINMNTPLMNWVLQKIVKWNSTTHAVLLWMMLSLLGAGISIIFFERKHVIPFLLLLWLSWPGLYNLKLGQVTYFVLPVLSLGFFLYQKNKMPLAAIVLGLLASIKLFFLIFILLFVPSRQWKYLVLFLLSFLFFFFFPLFHFSWSQYEAFFQLTHQYAIFIERATLPMNGSLLGVVANVAHFWHPSSTDLQIRLCTIILSLYFIIRWLIYDCKKLRNLPVFSHELRFSFLIVIALICSPLGWEYYLLFLLIPVIVLIRLSQQYLLSLWFYVFFSASLVLPYFAWMGATTGLAYKIQSFSVFSGLICFFIALCFAVKSVQSAISPRLNQAPIIVGILVVCVIINMLLLLFNYGMPYFLDPTQHNYLQHAGAIMQISH